MTQINTQEKDLTCPSCGSGLRYNTKANKMRCTACGYETEVLALVDSVQEYSFADYATRESKSVPFQGMLVEACRRCGCEVTLNEAQTATVCPMCGSAHISAAKQRTGIPPEGIIPFQLDKQEATQKFREWIKGLWFAPNKLKNTVQEGRLTGKFIPFWTYDAEAIAPYTAKGGQFRKVKNKDGEEETVTDWYPTSGIVSHTFDDITVCAVQGEGAEDIELAGAFDTIHNLKPFASEYLAGYSAEIYTIKADKGFETAKKRMKGQMKKLAESQLMRQFDTYNSLKITPKYTQVTYKHVLLPIWSSLFGYSGKTYRFIVNGESGETYGQRPYSAPKIIAAILVTLAILFGAFAFFTRDAKGADNTKSTSAAINISAEAGIENNIEKEYSDYGLVWTR